VAPIWPDLAAPYVLGACREMAEEETMRIEVLLLGAWALVVVVLQVRHLRRLRMAAREDAQMETDRYRRRGGRAR